MGLITDARARPDTDVSAYFQIRNLDSGKCVDFTQENDVHFTAALSTLTQCDSHTLAMFWYGLCSSTRRQANSNFISAVRAHDLTACKDLMENSKLEAIPQMNAKDARGWTPLHYAASLGFLDALKYILTVEGVVDLNARNPQLRTPLHLAAMEGWTESAAMLLEAGADPNCSDSDLMTPLHFSIENNNVDISCLLLSHSADPSLRNHTGQTAVQLLQLASPKLKSLLDESLASIDTRDCSIDVEKLTVNDMGSPVTAL